MGIKSTLKEIIRKFGWEVNQTSLHTSERALMTKVLGQFGVDLLVDVGANKGQYAVELIAAGYHGRILSFEPIKEAFDQLSRKARSYPRWEAFQLAVGKEEGEVEINVSQNLVSSSLLDITRVSIDAEPATHYTRKEKVKVVTIDSFLKDQGMNLHRSPLLKLDVQGYELEVLKGSTQILPSIRLVQSELSFVRLYEGSPLFEDIFSFMRDNQFELYTLMPGFRDPDSGRMLQGDAIFFNTRF